MKWVKSLLECRNTESTENVDKKILIVGCGGLGCELLKLVANLNINYITIIDDDTIELSNLNRQLFFTKNDIGKPKSITAAGAFPIKKSNVTLMAIKDNIMNYDVIFFSNFDVVFSCLDNIEARSYINIRCLIAKTVLVDGGSGGINGQSYFFDYLNNTECFDCIPKPIKKDEFICTIRTRPKEFKHCVIWVRDVLIGMELPKYHDDYYNTELKDFIENCSDLISCNELEKVRKSEEYKNLIIKIEEALKQGHIDKFDKSDKRIANFLYNASCIRAMISGISFLDFTETIGLAGSIIPSICTTNAIVASLMIFSLEKRCSFYSMNTKKLIYKIEQSEKNTDCVACSADWYIVSGNGFYTIKQIVDQMNLGDEIEILMYSDEYITIMEDFANEKDSSIKIKNNNTGKLILRNLLTDKKEKIFLYFSESNTKLYVKKIREYS